MARAEAGLRDMRYAQHSGPDGRVQFIAKSLCGLAEHWRVHVDGVQWKESIGMARTPP